MNINHFNDEKDLGLHLINIKTRPGQLSPFNGQVADFHEPTLAAEIRKLVTKKTSDVPYQCHQCHQPLSSSMPNVLILYVKL